MVVMVMCMSMTVFAADGISTEEQDLLDYFVAALNKHEDGIQSKRIKQYTAEATNALNQVTLDANACNELKAAVDAADKVLVDNKAHTPKDMKKNLPAVLKIANDAAGKYNMSVSVDTSTKDAIATVTIKTTPSPSGGDDVPAQENTTVPVAGGSIVRQTGVNYAATAGVAGVLGLGFVTAIVFALVQRKKANA